MAERRNARIRRRSGQRRPLFEPLEERHMLSCGGVFSIDNASAYETNGSAVFTVTLSGASCGQGETASVSYATSDGTATVADGDYTAKSGSLSFSGNGSQTISVPIANDGLTESDETFSVKLSNPVNATISTSSSAGTATIHDAAPSIWISDVQTAEEDAPVILTIQVSHASSVAITGNWSTADGTASSSGSPGDYDAATNGSFTIPASSTSVQIQVDINEDSVDEWDEYFTVTLSNVANATVGDGTAVVAIVDDEQTPKLFTGRISDHDSGIDDDCPVCAGDDLYLSWAEAYDGNYYFYSDYFWGSTTQRGPGSGPDDGCKEAQDNGKAADLFHENLLPQYQVASSGLTYVETRVTIPGFDVADQYSVDVTLTSAADVDTVITTVYYDGATLEAGDEIVLAVQVDAEALGLASGYYKTTSVVTAHDSSYPRSETTTGWTILVNRHGSPYGDLWWIPDLDRLHIYDTGVATGAALVRGDGTTAWFSKSGSTFTNRTDGSFSTLAQETVSGQTEYVLTTRYNEKFRFNASGYLIKRYDAQGNETEFAYDGQNRLDLVTDPFDRSTDYVYESGADRIDYIENFAGQRIEFTVDSASNDLVAVELDDPDGQQGSEPAPSYTLEYVSASGERYDGFLESIEFDMVREPGQTAQTSVLQLAYNELGQVERALNADGSDWELSSVQAKSLDHLVTGDGTTINDPAAPVLVTDLVAEKTNERGHTTTYTTDRFGNVTSIKDAYDRVTTIERNTYGQVTKITEPDPDGVEPDTGAVTQFSYLSVANGGYLASITNPDGSTRTFSDYNATFGVPTHLTDELGRETFLTLNSDGLIASIDQKVGATAGDANDIITEFTYTDGTTLPKGLLLAVEDAEGVVTEYDYFATGDEQGWLQSITYNSTGATEADRIVNSFGYDTQGNLTSFIDGEGRITQYEYDALNQLRKAIGHYPNSAPGGLRTIDNDPLEEDYDESGSGWSDGAITGFDDDQRIAEATTEPGAVATWTFDELIPGMTYEVAVTWEHVNQNGANNSPFSVYDGTLAGDLIYTKGIDQSIAPPQHPIYESPSEWYILGYFTPETDKLTVKLQSEGAQATKNVLADAVRINLAPPVVEYECNEQGGTVKETDAKGRVTEYGYDALMRLAYVKLPDPAGGSAGVYLRYGYDAAGNLTKVISPDPDGDAGPKHAPVTKYVYDNLNRVVSVLSPYPDARGVEVIDDNAGATSKFETSTGWTTVGSSGGYGGNHRWADDSGEEWADWKFTGLVPGKTYEVFVTWTPDAVNGATDARYAVYDGPPETFPSFPNWIPPEFDQTLPPGDFAALSDPNDPEDDNGDGWARLGEFTISGDALSVRLVNDNVDGNVIADAVRIVEARATTSYEYDHAYNLVRTIDALGNATEYGYDNRHRLLEVTEADPDGAGGEYYESPITRFVYDAASQLRRTIDPLGRVTRYLYDEDLPRLEEVRYPHPVVDDETQLLDDDEPEYTEPGWWTHEVVGGYGGTHSTSNNGNESAKWTFDDVAPGEYEVFVTWTDDATADNAVYVVEIDGSFQPSVEIDQQQTPADGDLFGDGALWQSIGDYTVDSGDEYLSIYVANSDPGKILVADAVRLMPKAPTYGYAYDETGTLESVTDPLGNATVYGYDPFYRLTTLTLPDPDPNAANDQPVWHYEYDKAHNTTLVTDPLDRDTVYEYDGLNRLVHATLPDPDGPGGGNPLESPEYFYDYDLDGNVLLATDPLSRVTSYEYDLWGRTTLATFPKPLGTETYAPYVEYAYDYLSRLTSLTENVEGGSTATRTFAYEYDALGRLVAEMLPDPADGTISGNSPTYRTAYGVLGQVLQETDARGNPTRYAYDNLYRLTKVTFPDPDGPGTGSGNLLPPVTKYAYDDASQVTEVATTLDAYYSGGFPLYDYAYTEYEYDRLGRTTAVLLPDPDTGYPTVNSPKHEYEYDAAGNVVAHTDPLGKVTDYAYDQLYRLVNRQDPDPDSPGSGIDRPSIDYGYDPAGNLTSLTDTLGNETVFVYDGLDRLIREEIDLDDPTGGDDRFYIYDAASRLTKKLDRNERKTTYVYDDFDRLVEERWFADDADSTADDVLKYAYDYVGNVTAADADYGNDAAWESTLDYARDRLGRVTGVGIGYDNAGGVADLAVDFAYAYDADGYRDSFSATIGSTPRYDFVSEYTFDPLGRMTAVTQAAQDTGASYNVVAEKRVEFAYRADGQFSKITRFAGATGTTSNDVVQSTYGYDQLGRLTSLDHVDVAGTTTPRAEYTWAYDEFNRLENATERFNNDSATDRGITHTYDHNGQLLSTVVDLPDPASEITTNYAYDANGNRTSGQTADADNYNRVLSDGTYSYRYDDEGNQIARTALEDGTREAMTWDHRNRLASIATQLPREVAHWRFDGDATNATGDGDLDGTLVGDTSYDDADPVGGESAGFGQYLVLDGDGDYVSLGDDDEFKIRDRDFSVSAWFNPVGGDAFMTIVEQGNPVNSGGNGYRIAYREPSGGTPYLEALVNDGSGSYQLLSKTYTNGLAGAWHHVALAIENDACGDITLYVDGASVASAADTQCADIQGGVLQIGSQGGSTPGYFERYIDDVRIWHEAIDPADVEALYESTTADALYAPTKIVEYGYDAFDRRVLKEIDADGNGSMADAGDEAHQYVYDGQDIVLAFDKDSELTNRYLHGPAVDQILADEQYTGGASPANTAGTTYWALADNLGSVRQLVTNLGEEVYRALFDGFGMMTVVVGATIEHIYGFTGREIDAESHLQHNRARYYDAALGRWISEDPIGMQDDENTHRYVKNSPTNATDPSGMAGFWSRAWNKLKRAVNVVKNMIKTHINRAVAMVKQAVNRLLNPVQAIKDDVRAVVEGVKSVARRYEEYEAYRDCMLQGGRDKGEAVAVGIVMVVGDVTGMIELMEGIYATDVYIDADGNVHTRDLTDDEADEKIANGLIAAADTGAAVYGAGSAAGSALAKGVPKPPRPKGCFTADTLVVMAAFEPTVVLAGIAVGQPNDESLTWCLLVATGIALAQAVRERRAGSREKPRLAWRDRFGFFGDDGDEETDEDEPRNESDAPPFAPRRSVPQAAIDSGAVDALCDRAAGRENVSLSAVDGAIATSTYGNSCVKPKRRRHPEPASRDFDVRLAARDAGRTTKQRRTAFPRGNRGRSWLAVAVCLSIGAFWFAPRETPSTASLAAGTARSTLITKAIRDIRVGDRVASDALRGDRDETLGADVEPATWRHVTLRAPRVDGSVSHVNLLRPAAWLEDRGAAVGKTIYLDVRECGIIGDAEVLAIAPCPTLADGDGRVVTGTFRHPATTIIDVHVDSLPEPIGTTPNHRFWSEDRQDYVAAGEMSVGERVRTLAGLAKIARIAPRATPEDVYNLEIHVDHVYHVGTGGVLVHNAGNCPYRDPQRPDYNNGATHDDHIQARSLGGDEVPSNHQDLPAETNLRKGGLEGELKKYEDGLIEGEMTPDAARQVIQGEMDSLGSSPPPRPMDPRVLDQLPSDPRDQ